LWLHSLKVAQLLRSAACLHTNQSRSYLNHLVHHHATPSYESLTNEKYMHYTITKPTRFQLYFLLNHFPFVKILFFLDKFQEDITEHHTTTKPINTETNNFLSPN